MILYINYIHIFNYTIIILLFICILVYYLLKTHKYLRSKDQLLLQIKERNEELEVLNSHISQQRDLLQQYHEKVTSSLLYAGYMQKAILPSDDILINSSFNIFTLFKPRDIVSGDFYFIKNINNKLLIAVGDSTGHGTPGACLSMMGQTFLTEIIYRSDVYSASDVLGLLRDRVKGMFQNTNLQDGMDLALCIIDKFTNKMQFAGANINLVLANNYNPKPWQCNIVKIKGDRMPIGSHPRDTDSFTNHEIQLNEDHAFYMFSDGYASQFGGKRGKKFKTSRFVKVLQHLQNQTIPEQKEILDRIFTNWKKEKEQVDDVLVIGIRLKSQDEILQNLQQVLVSWDNNKYSVGSKIIDYQHKQLVLHINQLYDAYMKHYDIYTLGNILDQLEQYIEYHFQTEEKILEQHMSDNVKMHIAEHRFFTERVSNFSNQFYSGNINITYEIILFLKDWLINHIQNSDFNCKHFFQNTAQSDNSVTHVVQYL